MLEQGPLQQKISTDCEGAFQEWMPISLRGRGGGEGGGAGNTHRSLLLDIVLLCGLIGLENR